MSELHRTKECDCWCNLDYCPVNCKDKRAFITDVHCFGEMKTPKEAKEMFVIDEEVMNEVRS